jgi:hypothetical protein
MKRLLRRPSPAMGVALLALFVALGGVSYGVAANTIGSRAIKDGSVLSRDVHDGAVQGRDVQNGTLRGRDVADGSLRGADVRDGGLVGMDIGDGSIAGVDVAPNALGDREIDEPQLDVQRLGGFDASRYVRNVKQVQTATANDAVTPKAAPPAQCPKGQEVLGGGAHVVAPAPVPVAIYDSGPNGNAWTAAAYATAPTGNWQLVSVAICG